MQHSPFTNLVDQLRWRALAQPNTCGYAFLGDGENVSHTLTYGQLDQQARGIAAMLLQTLQPGDRALLMYPPGLDFVSAFFGCLYAGVLATPAYPPHFARPQRSLPRLRAIARDADISAVLCTTEIAEKLPTVFDQAPEFARRPILPTVSRIGFLDRLKTCPTTMAAKAIAFLQYTSGSTAAPKGVMVSHRNIMHNLAYLESSTRHDASSVEVSWLPTYHDMGLFAGILFPLFKGCPSYLMPPVAFLQKPLRWLQAISRYRGTNSGGPNFAFDLCVTRTTEQQRRGLDLSCWRIAYNGAEPIRRQTLQSFLRTFQPLGFRPDALHPVYGLAEATVFVCGGSFEERAPAPHAPVSCGKPGFDTEVIIVDPDQLTSAPAGEVGEIWIRSESVAKGYWNRPLETEQAFTAFLADTGDGPFLRTGDLACLRGGELLVTGRIKDLIIIRGGKHYPQDIELSIQN